MPLNKAGAFHVTDPGALLALGDPRPQYVPQSDVIFGPSGIVLPQPLPPSSQVFPAAWYNAMNFPSVNVLFDSKRNGIAF